MTASTFKPHAMLLGGHLQTLAAVVLPSPRIPYRADQHVISLDDGDQIVLHDDKPDRWNDGEPVTILLHGLCGCHGSDYMVRMSAKLVDRGVRVFRMDMRGCGAGHELARELPHSGRSGDLVAVVEEVAQRCPRSPMWLIGVSMGGNIVLKMLGEVAEGRHGSGASDLPIHRAAVVAPPIDPARCCRNLQRQTLRPYGWYFIRQLRRRVPPLVAARSDWQAIDWDSISGTLWDFDDAVTAPLSGFRGVEDYYQQAASAPLLCRIQVPTMILASSDDPIIPLGCFHDAQLSDAITLETTRSGGHVGFVANRVLETGDRYWMDLRLLAWFGLNLASPGESVSNVAT